MTKIQIYIPEVYISNYLVYLELPIYHVSWFSPYNFKIMKFALYVVVEALFYHNIYCLHQAFLEISRLFIFMNFFTFCLQIPWGGERCSSVVKAFAHGAMGYRINPSW